MNSLRIERRSKGLTQEEMEEITGICQSYYSDIERGKHVPGEVTRRKIESALGGVKIDWLEHTGITLHNPDWYKAESLLKKLVEATFNMEKNQKIEFNKLVRKYFKLK